MLRGTALASYIGVVGRSNNTLPGGARDLFRWAVLKTRTAFSPVHNSTSEFARPYYYSFQEIVDTTGNREKGFEGLNIVFVYFKAEQRADRTNHF